MSSSRTPAVGAHPWDWCRSAAGGEPCRLSSAQPGCEFREFSTGSLVKEFGAERQRRDYGDGNEDNQKSDDVETSRQREHYAVSETVVEQISGQGPECDPAHRATEADHPGNRTDNL